MPSTSLATRVLRGTAGGVAATIPMTAVMLAARRMGLLPELPPQTITDGLLDAAGTTPAPSTRRGVAALNHVAFGAGCGGLFAALTPPMSRSRGALLGAAFGLGVWFTSYQGWVPALGFMPPASEDRPARPAVMIVAHLVFGSVLGALAPRR